MREIFVMGDMVIVAYRPKPGGEDALLALTREHGPILRALGLATAGRHWRCVPRTASSRRCSNGARARSPRPIKNPEVLAMWGRYEAVCEFICR
jgi:hypothetical protein